MKPTPISVISHYPVDIQKVWNALTNPDEMKEWFFPEIPDFQAQVGFETRFDVQSDTKTFIHLWEVKEVNPPNQLVLDWRYENYPGQGIVTFSLEATDKGTTLEVLNEGLETFPQEIPEFRPESCKAGWEYFLKERLKSYLK